MEDQVLLQKKATIESTLAEALRQACKKIAPVWPLENFVAVNPYLGLTDQKFDTVAQHLATVGGIQMTLPVSFYNNKIKEGKITHEDLRVALAKKGLTDLSVEKFIKQLDNEEEQENNAPAVASLIDIAGQVTGKDWNRFMIARVSSWAASYFDNGQATWAAANKKSKLFTAWKAEAVVDKSPEIIGLKGFRAAVKGLPNDPLEAAQAALNMLEITKSDLPMYLHRLLLKVGGWSAYAARIDWDSKLYGGKDGKLNEFLCVLICWEACLFSSLDSPKLRVKWLGAKKAFTNVKASAKIDEHLTQKLVLQEAFDIAAQRELIDKFKEKKPEDSQKATELKAQAVFCIDVRSEVYRRNLELVDAGIETIGFAGFFAFPINYVPLAHNKGEAQCPVLIKTGPTILEKIPDKKDNIIAIKSRILKHHASQLWKSFKSGAVTCFSFVSPIGLSYLPKLFTDSFGLTRPVQHPDKVGLNKTLSTQKSISLEVDHHHHEMVGIPLEQRIQMAKNALKAMSLTENFAPFVLIAGHGSTTVNNPHATGLDCGACGGHSGESNAKVAAAVLNDKDVRAQLKNDGIVIPDTTVFLACLHDTTTDELSIFNEGDVPHNSKKELLELKASLTKAGHAARTERALRMHGTGNVDAFIKTRSKDWSQVRPEWGLAGCSSFIVAPRKRTKDLDLGGRSFLHNYEWKKDNGFFILELIMTAPMVVTSWINLQYYGSTVDNKNFGSGNKTLHNVTAGVGVLEGFSGDLRVGLPMQSVHDGEHYQHEPVKLNVIIEAPIDAMNEVLQKHEAVKDLCDNGWIHLLALDEQGQVSHRYEGNLDWKEV